MRHMQMRHVVFLLVVQVVARAKNAVALGSGDQNGNSPTTASGAHSIAVGSNARAEQSSTIAMGKDAQATIEQGVALGSSSVTTGLRNAQAFDPANGRRNYFEEARNTGRAARSTMAGVSVGSSTHLVKLITWLAVRLIPMQ